MEQRIQFEGISIRYDKEGSGSQPVIVMHGWGCKASTVSILAQAALSDMSTVYNIDLPGFGGSDEPLVVWGIDDYTRFLEYFITTLGLDKPVLIGHSFGGRMAINYASSHTVAKVILVDAAGIKPRRSLKYYIKVYSFKFSKKLAFLFLGKERGELFVNKLRAKSGSSDYSSASPMMRRILSRTVNEDLHHCLPKIQAPTLLIWGERDTATPLKDAKLMEKLIPDAGLVSYPEAGHYSFLDRPAQTQAVIRSFLG